MQQGSANISPSTDAGDFNQGLIFLETNPAAITATDSLTLTSAIPEPASVLLMVAGLAGPARRRRRTGSVAR